MKSGFHKRQFTETYDVFRNVILMFCWPCILV